MPVSDSVEPTTIGSFDDPEPESSLRELHAAVAATSATSAAASRTRFCMVPPLSGVDGLVWTVGDGDRQRTAPVSCTTSPPTTVSTERTCRSRSTGTVK